MRPGCARRLDSRRSLAYGVTFAPPYASRLIHANYNNRGLTVATGVSAWADQIVSPSVNEADWVQATGSKQPLVSTFSSGKPAIAFDDTNDYLATSGTISLSSYSQITYAMSIVLTATGSGMLYESSVDSNTNPGGFYVYENGNILTVLFRNAAANSLKQFTITAGTHRLIFTLDVVGALAVSQVYYDGASQGGSATAANVGFGDFTHYMGMRAGTSEPWGGKVGDIWVYGDALTSGEIAIVDAALALRCV